MRKELVNGEPEFTNNDSLLAAGQVSALREAAQRLASPIQNLTIVRQREPLNQVVRRMEFARTTTAEPIISTKLALLLKR